MELQHNQYLSPECSDAFWAFARERYAILLRRRAGQPKPWTEDRVLQTVFFTNVFREDDRVTIWFRENIREKVAEDPVRALFACCLFRLFTLPSTAEALMNSEQGNLFEEWNHEHAVEVMLTLSPLLTGAYMIRGFQGMKKAESVAGIASLIWRERHEITVEMLAHGSIEFATKRLQEFPGIGGFMGYEMATDLRHTCVLRDAIDLDTWANPGPGCLRGLKELFAQHRDNLHSMRLLLRESHSRPELWPLEYPRMELREVEHTLCEFSKYMSAKRGNQPKRNFKGA